jgi:hypothetical protein
VPPSQNKKIHTVAACCAVVKWYFLCTSPEDGSINKTPNFSSFLNLLLILNIIRCLFVSQFMNKICLRFFGLEYFWGFSGGFFSWNWKALWSVFWPGMFGAARNYARLILRCFKLDNFDSFASCCIWCLQTTTRDIFINVDKCKQHLVYLLSPPLIDRRWSRYDLQAWINKMKYSEVGNFFPLYIEGFFLQAMLFVATARCMACTHCKML